MHGRVPGKTTDRASPFTNLRDVKRLICRFDVIIACEIADQLDIINKPTIEDGLVEFATEEIKVSSFVPRIPVSRDDSPFENQTPTEILERERLVFQKNYSASETTFMTVINPKLWASVNANEGALRTFRYARWKSIKYRLVVQSNPFVFGYLAMTCLPNDQRRHNNSLALSDYGWWSHDDCVVIDITSMPESSITVPWLSNNTWVDLEKWAAGGDVETTLTQLNGLKILYDNTINVTSSSVPKAFSISVFAKFEGVEVACPISPGASANRHEAQMLGFLGGVAAEVAMKSFEKKATSGIESLVNTGMDKAGEAASNYIFGGEEGVGEEFGVTSEAPAEPAVCAKSVEDGEGGQPQEVVPSVFGGMNYSCSRNVLGTGTMLMPRARQNSLSEYLQKPSMVNRRFFASGAGTVMDIPIWTGHDVIGHLTDLPSASRLRFLAQYFRFWRGSVTYTLFFISSPMVTFRFKVALDYQGGNLSAVDPGDTLQTIVTVRGTTVHQVTVPYLYTTPWQYLDLSGTPEVFRDIFPTLTVSEFSPASKSGDVVPSCFLLTYESANRDFVFTSQVEPMPYAQTPAVEKEFVRHEAQMQVTKFRSQDVTQFGMCDPVKFTSDGVGTFEAMAKRWSPRISKSLDRPSYYADFAYVTTPVVSEQSTLDSLCSIFYWNRGQYKIKIGFKVDETTDVSAVGLLKMSTNHPVSNDPLAGIPAEIRFTDGATAISYGLTQVIEAVVPFLSITEWVSDLTDHTSTTGAKQYWYFPNLWSQGATLPEINFVAVSAGRDFCFSYSLPPPYFGARWYDCVPYTPPAPSMNTTTPQSFSSHMNVGSARFRRA